MRVRAKVRVERGRWREDSCLFLDSRMPVTGKLLVGCKHSGDSGSSISCQLADLGTDIGLHLASTNLGTNINTESKRE